MATWDFVVCAPDAAGTPIVRIDQPQGRKLVQHLNGPDTAEFTIDGRSEQAQAISSFRTDLKVYRNGPAGSELLFRGRITETDDTIDADSHTVTVPAVDYRGWLERRIVYADRTWNNVRQSDIAWDLVRHDQAPGTQFGPGGDLFIRRGPDSAPNINRSLVVEAGQSIPDALDAVSNLWEGFEWWVSPTMLFHTGWRGRQQIDFPLVYGTTVSSVTRTLNANEYANSIRVSGGSETQNTPAPSAIVIVDDIASRVEGRIAVQIGNQDLKRQPELDAFAQGELFRRGTIVPSYVFKLKPDVWDGPTTIGVGDRVDYRVRSGRLDVVGNDRVAEVAVTIGESGGPEDVEVTMGDIRRGLLLLLKTTPERLERLERR